MATLEELGRVRFHGMLGGKNVSAITFFGDRALVVSDEVTARGNVVQVFEEDGHDFRAVPGELIVLDSTGAVGEMDLEGIAVDDRNVFVLGSHSARRRKPDSNRPYATNRAALTSPPEFEAARDVLLHLEFDAAGKAREIQRASLRDFLDSTEPFKSFGKVASKENGVDVEGLAVRDNRLYVGFRGPVLRGNFTPILRCRFGSPIGEPELFFVNLGGRGVRDLARVESGLLILAGPVGDGPGSFQLYLWDGRDGVPGTGAPASVADPGIQLIGDLPILDADAGDQPNAAKAEGVALIKEMNHHWIILVVFDGLKNGHATRFRVEKPQ